MTITWTGDLVIDDAQGNAWNIATQPRHGGRRINNVNYSGNAQFHAVGFTYGVLKLPSDPPHWSTDGH